MSASTWQALRAASSFANPVALRYVGGRRLISLLRTLHTSPPRQRENPANTPSATRNHVIEPPTGVDQDKSEHQKQANGPDDSPEKPPRSKDPSNYGSASRRAGRNIRRVKELPQVFIPQWFFDKNVITSEEFVERHNVVNDEATSTSTEGGSGTSHVLNDLLSTESDQSSPKPPDAATKDSANKYLAQHLKINQNVLSEVISLIHSGLRIPGPQYADAVSSIKPHVVLSCPKSGGSAYLSGLVHDIARASKTDFLRLTPQDIAEIGGDYMEEPWSFQPNSLSSLGYDVAQVGISQPSLPPEESAEQNEYEEQEEGEDEEESHQAPGRSLSRRQGIHNLNIVPAFVGTFTSIQDIFKTLKNPNDRTADNSGQSSKLPQGKPAIQIKDSIPDMKSTLLVESLVNVPEHKRALRSQTHIASERTSQNESSKEYSSVYTAVNNEHKIQMHDAERGSTGLIVLVEDYPLMNMTISGGKFLDKLHEVVDSRRKDGQPVLIVGTASSRKILPSGEQSAIEDVQTQPWGGPVRTVVVPIRETTDGVMRVEQKRKIKDINLRHMRDMLRRIAPVPEQVSHVVYDWDLSLESKWAFIGELERSVWTLDKVNRTATIALGMLERTELMGPDIIGKAIGLIEASDGAKYRWLKKESERKSKEMMDIVQSNLDDVAKEDSESKMRRLRKKCNSYEKKLLNGVVDANNIRTTFADVQAPPETKDALKTLTSLSLVRPDAFTYGVLATDRIPGLLLYGPPGTGKTLLAKAVAKESGATMLEVSGSDVYDMYVGEGEKNVKAIFTLAKKLSPCVVFIDEADAILGSRSSGHSRTSHRELINQFLREWDGMTDMSAFIMVATNRPFDLDEASLRRLPRRLLVDLPMEKDREAILKIHLKDEALDPEVSIPQLASQTPFYSGSDLKNLCVAAALACVREEFDAAMAHNRGTTEDEYQYAEKRTLHPRHFTKAMGEISASISEDMGSLSAIRKFDEKYGDRRGRRKKLGGYGFKTVDDAEKLGSDAARVRNQT
ncbi:MAG: hypothetical protein Q9163_000329 [Psora crenata]